MSESCIKPTGDVKVGILSSEDHLQFMLQGQVLNNIKDSLIYDLAGDDIDIARFQEKEGHIIFPDDECKDLQLILGNDHLFTQTPLGDDVVRRISIPVGMADRTQLLEDAMIALTDRYASDVARSEGWSVMSRNQQNYDYLMGLNDYLKSIKNDVVLTSKMQFSQTADTESDISGSDI